MKIGIIGGRNGIGAAFAAYFQDVCSKKQTLEVLVSGRETEKSNKKIVQECDLVIFAVPISVTLDVMEEMIPHSRKDQIWADFTSIKGPFVGKMLKSKAEVVGMHPLFGPMRDIRGHKVFVSPSRISKKSYQTIQDLFSDFELIEKSPEEHDLLMGVVQNVSHFSDFVMGETLRRIGMDIGEILEYSTPSYQLKLEVMGRMFDQSSDLYANIATENPKGALFSQIFTEVSEEFYQFVRSGDPTPLKHSFEAVNGYLGAEFCHAAHKHSQRFMHLYSPEVREEIPEHFDVAIFGDRYSHTDEASEKLLDGLKKADQNNVSGYFYNIFEVFEAVSEGRCRYGIVPYENSTQGSVFDTLDGLFTHDSVKIVDLLEVDIEQHLLGLPGARLKEIQKIYSHPQALAQSKNWIVDNMDRIELINTSSTTRAGQRILQDSDARCGAIGSRYLAQGLGLEILKENLQLEGNRTKFVLLENVSIKYLRGNGGVSFSVWFDSDRSGSLAGVLNFLAERNINLVKLDSRRANDAQYGGYWFFMDAEISIQDFRTYMKDLEAIVGGVKVLGSW